MIEVAPEIFYNPSKGFEEQSDEFKEYAIEKYNKTVVSQVTSAGYPDFNDDGSVTFHVEDALLTADVTRIQVIPFSTADRRIKDTLINITVKEEDN